MDPIEDEEPIYELAVECEKLFIQQISRLNDGNQPNSVKILSELSQRFAAWAAFLGVFAASNVCLDRRLRRHVEIQDQALRLLDIMQRNLTCLFERDDSSDRIDTESSDACQSSLQPLDLSIDSLEAISGAIERLNHLGLSIRHSSVTSQTTKARKFAETFDLASFEGVAYQSVKTLYLGVSEDLLEQLTRSMTETYARFLRRKSRHEQLRAPRSRPQRAMPLSTITEEPIGAFDIECPADSPMQVRQRGEGFTTNMLKRGSAHTLPVSEPTSLDSQEVRKRFKDRLSPAVNDKTMSILVNQTDYPPPTKGSLTCEWCFSPLSPDSFEGANWRYETFELGHLSQEMSVLFEPLSPRRHMNEDFEPYICISENCSESLIRFASSTQWLEHMLTMHGKSWHCEVHTPPSWACPVCDDQEATFSRPEHLTEHLENLHAETFTVSQVQAIVRQSRSSSPRGQDICPLCCLPVRGTYDSPSEGTGHDNGANPQMTNKYRDPNVPIGPSLSNTTSLEMVASHVAGHLQGIMLLALRLITIDVAMDVSADHQSTSGRTDDWSSLISSSQGSLYQDMDNIEDVSLHGENEVDPENDAPLEHIPDSEHIDWSVVPRRFEAPPQPGLEDITLGGDASQYPDDRWPLGCDLEELISNFPTGKPCHENWVGHDLEEFISNPPFGAPRDQNYLGWDLEEFISNPPAHLFLKEYLGQDLERFIAHGPV